ncbi:MAG: radical SAM protein [Thermoplasmatales archaeon]|nr:radical SAM protein [Thermoplasmatales archaeon]
MKILLVNAYKNAGYFSRLRAKFFIPTLSLLQIASCTPEKHQVKIVNEWYEKVDFEEECDLVGISAFTPDAFRAYEIADEFRKRGIKVVIGGYHATAMPEEAKEHADAVVIGEAENSWKILLDDFEKGKLKQFYGWKKVEGSNIPPPKRSVDNLNSFSSAIQATRGCPYRCEFCQLTAFNDNIHRKRRIEDVVREFSSLPTRIVWFHDASLTINPSYSKNLFKKIIENKIRKKWIAFGNMQILSQDIEILRLAEKAGCVAWMVGIESISQKTIDEEIKKRGNIVEKIPKMIEKIQKEGMMVWGSFIFGFDNDKPEIFDTTLEAILQWGIDLANFSILTPLPGTPVFKKMLNEGRILTFDWSKYDMVHAVFEPKGMSVKELEGGVKRLYVKFYSMDKMARRFFNTKGTLNKFLNLFANLSARNLWSFYFNQKNNL